MLQNSREITRRLKREGWTELSKRGSHLKLRRGSRTIIVPHPKKDLPQGTARAIAKLADRL